MSERTERERSLLRVLFEEDCGALYLTVVGAVADELLEGAAGPGYLTSRVAERCSVGTALVRSVLEVMLDQGWVVMVGRRLDLDTTIARELRSMIDAGW